MKKIISLFLACVLVFAVSISAFAVDPVTVIEIIGNILGSVDSGVSIVTNIASSLESDIGSTSSTVNSYFKIKQILAYWKEFATELNLSEDDFCELWFSIGDADMAVLAAIEDEDERKFADSVRTMIEATLAFMDQQDDLSTTWNVVAQAVYHDSNSPTLTDSGVQISSDDFKEGIIEQNENITPKNRVQTLVDYQSDFHYFHINYPYLDLQSGSSGFTDSHFDYTNGVYLLPFYDDGDGGTYYASLYFHIYYATASDGLKYLFLEINSTSYADIDFSYCFILKPFSSSIYFNAVRPSLVISAIPYTECIRSYDSFSASVDGKSVASAELWYNFNDSNPSDLSSRFSGSILSSAFNYISYDLKSSLSKSDVASFFSCSSLSSSTYTFDFFELEKNVGYVASNEPFQLQYAFDVTKIPSNQIITINGDTIYDYSITNPDTGESTTINNYITNNYVYPDSDDDSSGGGSGSGSSSGGTVSGNVNVGGNISVGGEVGVDVTVSVPDINVNVNVNDNNSGSFGTSSVSDSVPMPDVDVTENLPESPQNFIDYIKILFDWLPPQVLALLIGGLAAAIFCRVWGR